jgi:hypothetical protein
LISLPVGLNNLLMGNLQNGASPAYPRALSIIMLGTGTSGTKQVTAVGLMERRGAVDCVSDESKGGVQGVSVGDDQGGREELSVSELWRLADVDGIRVLR